MRHVRRATHQRRPLWDVWGRRLLSNSLPTTTRPTVFRGLCLPEFLRIRGWKWRSPSRFGLSPSSRPRPERSGTEWSHGTVASGGNIAGLQQRVPHRHQYFPHHQEETRPTKTRVELWGWGQFEPGMFSLHRSQHWAGGKDQKSSHLL